VTVCGSGLNIDTWFTSWRERVSMTEIELSKRVNT
jgi:hypothetical protein